MAGSEPGVRELDLLRRAACGDAEAMKAVARMALPSYREKYRELDDELDYSRAEVWDVDGMRAWALDPETEIEKDAFLEVWEELLNTVLAITSSTGPMLGGNHQESRIFEQRLRQASFDLFLLVNNPSFRYTIIAGFEPRFREDVDEWLTRIGREAWGTVEALVQDELQIDNYPPETAGVIQRVADQIRSSHESRGDEA